MRMIEEQAGVTSCEDSSDTGKLKMNARPGRPEGEEAMTEKNAEVV